MVRLGRYAVSSYLFVAMLTALMVAPSAAQAGVLIDSSENFAVLYEGTGGKSLQFSNSSISGNIGIGGTGKWADAGGCSGQCQINGVVEFLAANTGQFSSSSGTTYTPALSPGVNPLYSQAAVTTALNNISTLNTGISGGNNLALTNANQSINESTGALETINGVQTRVFNITSYSAVDATVLTIVGDGSGDPVVFNFAVSGTNNFGNSNVTLGGSVAFSGTGLTSPDQLLWNFQSTSKNISLTNNGNIFKGVILAPNDTMQMNHAILDGRFWGGDSANMQIVSGAHINSPNTVPEPGSVVLLAASLIGFGISSRLRKRSGRDTA